MKKTLIAYFSASGVTAKLARNLAAATNATLFEIKPSEKYTPADLDWTNKQSRSTTEMNDPSSRPDISEKLPNMSEYENIFIGFPIWWYIAPRIIYTFLESYDFSGKTLIPFATSGSSGMGETDRKLRAICPNAKWREGKLLNRASAADIAAWIKHLDL